MGSTCVVTGGSNGIGWEVCSRLLARELYSHCAVLDVGRGELEPLVARYGDRIALFECDVSSRDSVVAAFAEVDAWGPPVRGLVNSAGISRFAPALELTPEHWREVLDVNVDGTVYASQEAAQRMIAAGGGSMVNLASVSAHFGWPRRLAYSTSKAAVEQITRTLAVEWAPHTIRVNAVAPGYIETPMVRTLIEEGRVDVETYAPMHALKRFGTPGEVAEGILFLLSDAASFITGVVLPIDGGFIAVKVP